MNDVFIFIFPFLILIMIMMFASILFNIRPSTYLAIRRWFQRRIDSIGEVRQRYLSVKRHIVRGDWLKFFGTVVGALFIVMIISGMLSHFTTISRADKVCFARLGIDKKECDKIKTSHEYYIPESGGGLFDFSYKMGIEYKCGCSIEDKIYSKMIGMEMKE